MTIGPQLGQGCTPEHLVWQLVQFNTLPNGEPEDPTKPSLCLQLEYNFCTGTEQQPEWRFELNLSGWFPGLGKDGAPGYRRWLMLQGDMSNPDGFMDLQFAVGKLGSVFVTTPSDTVDTGERLFSAFGDGRVVAHKQLMVPQEARVERLFAKDLVVESSVTFTNQGYVAARNGDYFYGQRNGGGQGQLGLIGLDPGNKTFISPNGQPTKFGGQLLTRNGRTGWSGTYDPTTQHLVVEDGLVVGVAPKHER